MILNREYVESIKPDLELAELNSGTILKKHHWEAALQVHAELYLELNAAHIGAQLSAEADRQEMGGLVMDWASASMIYHLQPLSDDFLYFLPDQIRHEFEWANPATAEKYAEQDTFAPTALDPTGVQEIRRTARAFLRADEIQSRVHVSLADRMKGLWRRCGPAINL